MLDESAYRGKAVLFSSDPNFMNFCNGGPIPILLLVLYGKVTNYLLQYASFELLAMKSTNKNEMTLLCVHQGFGVPNPEHQVFWCRALDTPIKIG
jgi:hypothetical protein